ncbi:hypothetical protein AVEN_244370-1, partial [Araneus ventricosus]
MAPGLRRHLEIRLRNANRTDLKLEGLGGYVCKYLLMVIYIKRWRLSVQSSSKKCNEERKWTSKGGKWEYVCMIPF